MASVHPIRSFADVEAVADGFADVAEPGECDHTQVLVGAPPGFKLTGQMGDVMQESANIAYTFVRHIAPKYGVPEEFFEENSIHLHIPAGATPKDTISARLSNSAPNLLWVLVIRAIRPSRPSSSKAARIAIGADSKSPRKAAITA